MAAPPAQIESRQTSSPETINWDITCTKMNERIRHVYHARRQDNHEVHDDEAHWADTPRGWIDPDGHFRPSSVHWEAIRSLIEKKKRGRRSRATGTDEDHAELGERAAQRAYAMGWISLSHGGVLNAVGHRNVFHSKRSPALATLRRLLARVPHSTVRIETQIGKIDTRTGRHEDFDVQEYELSLLVRRGTLRKVTY